MSKPSKRKKRAGGYVQKWEEILAAPAYRDLKPIERCLLEEMQRLYRPGRNGRLSISIRNAAKLVNANKDTVSMAFDGLAAHGFIELTRGEQWQEGRAREWRITFEPFNGREPTDEWQSWHPSKTVFNVPGRNKKRPQKGGHERTLNSDMSPKKSG